MMAQLAPKVGDIACNTQLVLAAMQRAEAAHCDMLVLPELGLTGYPPEDLLWRNAFMDEAESAVETIVAHTAKTAVVFGHPRRENGLLLNSATLAAHGKVVGVYDKRSLPNYGVFDERRYFTPGSGPDVFEVHGWRIGIGICEDLWDDDVAEKAASRPRDVLLNLNASPFHVDKQLERESLMQRRAARFGVPVVYVNPVGGQDEIVFDGGSHAVDASGMLLARAPMFECADVMVDLAASIGEITPLPEGIQQMRQALVLGVRDYVRRNGSSQVVIGLSGGIDSALVAALACEALGAENVLGVLMPSRYSSDHSISDAAQLADNLGIETIILPIESPVNAVDHLLAGPFNAWGLGAPDVTEENVQARIRGLLLMAVSNKTGRMLLTTGNKSEMAVGYATLYGDMAGGFAPLKDVYKVQVFALSRHINRKGELIPESTISKPPSAELRPDQKDSDSLPDYEVLDGILQSYIELGQDMARIAARGFEPGLVERVIRMLYIAEYKRRQAPPGVKITQKAFGRDRRYPITHGFREHLLQNQSRERE
ncbi:MAG: NAD+ synthase [Zetaproteobacteria bacterium CG06_land_8_20_14_3_00_59_53]|nr:MAG: NAD+ synthase [Zetaproteobacteria bacterium CG2_30_59_37]PIO89846.1 MAG: NAD+ synthase [Zetaproteobacteria bacterium CG23_combo_of_CG06-09_8_20_14_all_59_86]PIQ64209.1 MAG: NAD+ synthase [Zetaproteobacteria bacterium CG11_big_fil_rev_8_21_14_0_20_59_439]PIU70445.1 MAG: NAD+ synthase [Zetaproteobacteria bacterium CG06_land_8_20_14_3_00_59_53]PIU97432.1 MAG: NAD+ synthase [Zetaproteobacteria bacterium CG03_land_8_20_14_0_80_59_51]PIY46655.1 MAG: NAD+ synthase [Zetaproteobacteria bacteriu